MIEAAVVVDENGEILYAHAPAGRTAVSLPDSRRLWEVLWTARDHLGGVAHTHPGRGVPRPSREDLTTFAACEAALGHRLDWWIATADQAERFRWCGPGRLDYGEVAPGPMPWLDALRALSA